MSNDNTNGTNPVPLNSNRNLGIASGNKSTSPDEQALLDELSAVIDPQILGNVDFSDVANAIRRTRQNAATVKSNTLTRTAVTVGIELAGDFAQQNDTELEDDANAFNGWK